MASRAIMRSLCIAAQLALPDWFELPGHAVEYGILVILVLIKMYFKRIDLVHHLRESKSITRKYQRYAAVFR